MALRIGDDVYRNMPEQVAKNQSDILELSKYYDLLKDPIKTIEIDDDGNLIFTMANDDVINAGLIKFIDNVALESNHLIVYYIDGTNQDLGDIFDGNVAISGNLTANSIIENMSGYLASTSVVKYITFTYVSIVKTGNKITLAIAGLINLPTGQTISEYTNMGSVLLYCPADVMAKIYPAGAGGSGFSNGLSAKNIQTFYDYIVKADINVVCRKSGNAFEVVFYGTSNTQTQIGTHVDENFAFRYEETFLLSDNLAA